MVRFGCLLLFSTFSWFILSAEEPASVGGSRFEQPAFTEPAPVPSFLSARALIEKNHIVAFYGHPNSRSMGILGEFATIDDMAARLREYTGAYAAAAGEKGAIPAFHIVFATAHPDGEVGIIRKGRLMEYIEYAEKNEILVFIDHQIGKYPLADAVRSMLPYLKSPNVHLAIDPEWATPIPGKEIGSITAEELNKAQEMIQNYMEDQKIPGEKMLVVHQFNWKMISGRHRVKSDFPGVLLVHNADGFGTPGEKYNSYAYNKAAANIPLKGFKLFLEKSWRNGGYDVPLLPPEEVLALDPVPVFIQYQ